jgi:hypothetical protein
MSAPPMRSPWPKKRCWKARRRGALRRRRGLAPGPIFSSGGCLSRAVAPASTTTKVGGYGSSRARGRHQACGDRVARHTLRCRPGLEPGPIFQRRMIGTSYRASVCNNKGRWLWALAREDDTGVGTACRATHLRNLVSQRAMRVRFPQQNHPRPKTDFRCRINPIAADRSMIKNISISFFQKSCSLALSRAHKRGVSRSSRTLSAGCDGLFRVGARSIAGGRPIWAGRRNRMVLAPRCWRQLATTLSASRRDGG